MEKVPTLFRRGDDKLVVPEVNPICAGVFSGDWIPRRKYDGHAMLLGDDGEWAVRWFVKSDGAPFQGFVPASHSIYGAWGWQPIWPLRSWDLIRPFQRALTALPAAERIPGSYELVGYGIGTGSHRDHRARLVRHADAEVLAFPFEKLSFEALRTYMLKSLYPRGVEGIVWHDTQSDSMAKLKVRDFWRNK